MAIHTLPILRSQFAFLLTSAPGDYQEGRLLVAHYLKDPLSVEEDKLVDRTFADLKGRIKIRYKNANNNRQRMLKQPYFQQEILFPTQLLRPNFLEIIQGETDQGLDRMDVVDVPGTPEVQNKPPQAIPIPNPVGGRETPARHLGAAAGTSRSGRPPVASPLKGSRALSYHVAKVRASHSEKTLQTAYHQKLRESGKLAQAKMVTECTRSPNRAKNLNAMVLLGEKYLKQPHFTRRSSFATFGTKTYKTTIHRTSKNMQRQRIHGDFQMEMANCPLCDAKPLQINDLNYIKDGVFKIKNRNWKYGISPLHARIRFLECILHLSYRQFKKWRRTKELMVESKARQAEVQQWLIDGMGIRVDFPTPGGSGTSNDGNTARRAFMNYPLFSSITGVPEELVEAFYNVLTAINCKRTLNDTGFTALGRSAAELYVKHFPLYPMPSSVHKVLIHGPEIARIFNLALGWMGEEAGEARNKEYRKIRLGNTRKSKQIYTMWDLMNRTLETSDPKLSMNLVGVKIFRKREEALPSKVLAILEAPTVSKVNRRLNFDIVDDYDDLDEDNEHEPDLVNEPDETNAPDDNFTLKASLY